MLKKSPYIIYIVHVFFFSFSFSCTNRIQFSSQFKNILSFYFMAPCNMVLFLFYKQQVCKRIGFLYAHQLVDILIVTHFSKLSILFCTILLIRVQSTKTAWRFPLPRLKNQKARRYRPYQVARCCM